MKSLMMIAALAAGSLMLTAGCYRDRSAVVEPDHHRQDIYREVYVDGRPPPIPPSERMPQRPHQKAAWVPGHWDRDGGYWVWHPGHWQ